MIEIPLLLPVPENLQRDNHGGYLLKYYSDDFVEKLQDLFLHSFHSPFKIEVSVKPYLTFSKVPLYYHLYDASVIHWRDGDVKHRQHSGKLQFYCVPMAPDNQILFKMKMKSDWLNESDADDWLNEIYKLEVPKRNDVSTNYLWLQLHGSYKINTKSNKLIDVKPSSITCELLICNHIKSKPKLPWKKLYGYNNRYTLPVFTFPKNNS